VPNKQLVQASQGEKEKLTNLFFLQYFFAIFNAVFVPIIYFFLVETKNRSLEELDVIFASGAILVRKEKVMPQDLSMAESRRILGLP
jgi:Sugar (and other) transporter